MNGQLAVLAFGFGIVSASTIALGAVGFTLQYGISGVFNVSYGAMMMVAAYVAYLVHVTLGANIWLGVAAAAAVGCVLALASERLLFTPFFRRRATAFAVVMVSLALGIFAENVIVAIAGPGFLSYQLPPGRLYDVAGTKWTGLQVALVAIAVVAMLAVHLLLRGTKLGKAMRATAADPELASSCGINTRRCTSLTWAVSGLLLGLSGVALAINAAAFSPVSGDLFVFIVFAAAVVGGLGQPYGAMLGALIIGIATEEMSIWSPQLKYVAAFALLIAMLLIRPGGLLQLGGRARRDSAAA